MGRPAAVDRLDDMDVEVFRYGGPKKVDLSKDDRIIMQPFGLGTKQ